MSIPWSWICPWLENYIDVQERVQESVQERVEMWSVNGFHGSVSHVKIEVGRSSLWHILGAFEGIVAESDCFSFASACFYKTMCECCRKPSD